MSAFLFVVLFTLLLTAVGLPTMQGGIELNVGMPILTAYQFILAIICILFMRKLRVLDEDDFKFKR